MARVNVDQKALTDPRFTILGSHLNPLTHAARETVESAFGLFLMIRVWNYCMERGVLEVPARDLDALYPGLSDAMIDAELGELIPRSRARLVRIKGGLGRLDWLEKMRTTGRENGAKGGEHGVKGGRPRKDSKPPPGVSENGVGGLLKNPPPAPAPAPAPGEVSSDEETLSRKDTHTEPASPGVCVTELMAAWNDLGAPFPRVLSFTDKRKTALKARCRDPWWIANWWNALQRIPESAFLRGESERGWVADIDWFLRPDTVQKLVEGKYAGGGGPRAASVLDQMRPGMAAFLAEGDE